MTRRSQSITLGLALLIAAVVVYNSGCGPSARRNTLIGELAALNTARDVFVKWDLDYQTSLVDKAVTDGATKEEAKRRVQAYRATFQTAVLFAFAYAYDEIASAATDDKKPLPKLPAHLVKTVGELKPGQDPPPDFTGKPPAEKTP